MASHPAGSDAERAWAWQFWPDEDKPKPETPIHDEVSDDDES